MSPERAWIALGSNLGDRRAHLAAAVAQLRASAGIRVEAVSTPLETAPLGGPAGQGPYLNAVASLSTRLPPRALLERLLAIERAEGRERRGEVRFGPRTLDLDLLLYGDLRLDEPGLVLPHPRMEERVFVLAPLAELAPDLLLPRSGLSVRARLAQLQRQGT